LLNILNFQLRV